MGNACSEGLALLGVAGSHRQPARHAGEGTSAVQHVSQRVDSTTTLRETYDIAEFIGAGSFGTVRKSTSRKTGCVCVVKSSEKRGPQSQLDLANEVAVHAMCDHPNIVKVFDIFDNPTWIHIAMEACEGGDLYDLLYEGDEGGLSEEEGKVVMQQVLRAVLYLHCVRHVAHRDLKLENLLLKYRNVPLEHNAVKVIDFGLAAPFAPGLTDLSAVCGTEQYMAPEVDEGPYDEKCDIWSCGVVLYELLTASNPFYSDSSEDTRCLVKAVELSLEGFGFSCEVEHLLRQLCSRAPWQRPSAEESLQSPWFHPSELAKLPRLPLAASVGENLRAFSSCSSLQKLALRVAASRLDDPELVEQRTAFQLLDKNGDGRLTPDEVGEGCPELGLAAPEAALLFRQLDTDGSGWIEYSEFLSAAIGKDSLTDHACWEAFRFCDLDNRGSVSEKNIWELLYGPRAGRLGAAWLAECGCGGGGVSLDFEQFASMLRAP